MISAWDIGGNELGKIVFPESWSNALLQRVVVGDDVSNIYETRSTLRWGTDTGGRIPFKTSLISPGGDSRRNLETARMRSETSITDEGKREAIARRSISLSLSRSPMSRVQLYIYDLSNGLARQLSLSLTGKQIDGIWYAHSVQWKPPANHLD